MAPMYPIHNMPSTSANTNGTADTNATPSSASNSAEGVSSFTLFVGQVPNSVNEESLKHLFSQYGLVTEAKILMDRVANKPRGCAFITFADKSGAESAIANLHENLTLPGASRPLIVRYSSKQLAVDNPNGENFTPLKLYVSNLSKLTTEEEVKNLFSQYGSLVDDVVILKDQVTNASKGVAFIKYSKMSDAMHAINSLHDRVRDKDAANMMQVKFAHTPNEKKNNMKSSATNGHLGGNNGTNLHQQVASAHHIGTYYPAHFNSAYAQQHYNPYALSAMGGFAAYNNVNAVSHTPHNGVGHHSRQNPVPRGPAGANLFVYGIPESYTDTDLSALFTPFGHVINAKVYRDLTTGKSKGFGFISYQTLPEAQQACANMNNFIIAGRKLTVKPKTESGDANAANASSNPTPLQAQMFAHDPANRLTLQNPYPSSLPYHGSPQVHPTAAALPSTTNRSNLGPQLQFQSGIHHHASIHPNGTNAINVQASKQQQQKVLQLQHQLQLQQQQQQQQQQGQL